MKTTRNKKIIAFLLALAFGFTFNVKKYEKVEAAALEMTLAGLAQGAAGVGTGAAVGAALPYILLAVAIYGAGYYYVENKESIQGGVQATITGIAQFIEAKVLEQEEPWTKDESIWGEAYITGVSSTPEWLKQYQRYDGPNPEDKDPMKIDGGKFKDLAISAGMSLQQHLAGGGKLDVKFYPNPFGQVVPLNKFYQNPHLTDTYYSTLDIPETSKTIYAVHGITESLVDYYYHLIQDTYTIVQKYPNRTIETNGLIASDFYIVYDKLLNTYTQHNSSNPYTQFLKTEQLGVKEFYVYSTLERWSGESFEFFNFFWSQYFSSEQEFLDFLQKTSTERFYNNDTFIQSEVQPEIGPTTTPEEGLQKLNQLIPSKDLYVNVDKQIDLSQDPSEGLKESFSPNEDLSQPLDPDNVGDIDPNAPGDIVNSFIPDILPQSFDALKELKNVRVDPPIIYINLYKIFRASVSKIAPNLESPWEDEDIVFFDFGSMNQYQYNGLPLIDYFRILIGSGYIISVLFYVYKRFTREDGGVF